MNILCSLLCFILFLLIGNILMFVDMQFFLLLPWFLLYLIGLRYFYRQANCKALESKDFLFALIFTGTAIGILGILKASIHSTAIAYLYLTSFVSILLYVDSIRFKSLM